MSCCQAVAVLPPQPGDAGERSFLSTSEGRAAWHDAPRWKQVRLLFDHSLHQLDLAVRDGRDRSIRAAVRFLHECQTGSTVSRRSRAARTAPR
jgi:hypothetical protein